jgi:two-component system alkaline phosphatase synthesis response regulator PhoP
MAHRILVVDDEVHLAKIIEFTLKHEGYSVSVAFDGEEALEKIRNDSPDLIILDLMLPIVDGYRICNRLKADERYMNIPVIILTARNIERENIEEPIQADLFMEKPFNTDKLLKNILDVLEPKSRSEI